MASTNVETIAQASQKTSTARGYAAHSATTPLELFSLERRKPGPKDIEIEILFCGVCHSDLHTVRNEWTNTVYPVVPGHEIVGRVRQVGSHVRKYKSGDHVAVRRGLAKMKVLESTTSPVDAMFEPSTRTPASIVSLGVARQVANVAAV